MRLFNEIIFYRKLIEFELVSEVGLLDAGWSSLERVLDSKNPDSLEWRPSPVWLFGV